MPWPTVRQLTDSDLNAVWQYLSSIPCTTNLANINASIATVPYVAVFITALVIVIGHSTTSGVDCYSVVFWLMMTWVGSVFLGSLQSCGLPLSQALFGSNGSCSLIGRDCMN